MRDEVRLWILHTVRSRSAHVKPCPFLRESELLELAEAQGIDVGTLERELDRLLDAGRIVATGDERDLTLTVPSYHAPPPALQLPLVGVGR